MTDKYKDSGNVENNFNCVIKKFTKENSFYRYTYLLIKYNGKQLEQEIIGNYLLHCIKELEISEIGNKNTTITTVFMVQKSDKVFEKTTERMIAQGKRRFLLPVYVNLETRQVHFSAQENEMWENVYHRLWNNFKKYIKDIME